MLTLAIMIITINDDIDPPRYTHHVIWRRVDPPNPCFSLCYRSQQDYLKCLSLPQRCYEDRFVVVEMFDRNIQACWPQDALPPSWCCRQGAKRPRGIWYWETLVHLKFWLFLLRIFVLLLPIINSQLFRRQMLVLRRYFSDHLVRPVHEALAAAAVNFVFENRLKVGSRWLWWWW